MEKNIPSKWTGKKKAGVAILISDKIDLKTKAIKRDTKWHFIILKGRICQEDIHIVNIYAPNIWAPKYIRKILEDFKKDIDSNTLTLEDFNTPLSKWTGHQGTCINNTWTKLKEVVMRVGGGDGWGGGIVGWKWRQLYFNNSKKKKSKDTLMQRNIKTTNPKCMRHRKEYSYQVIS